MLFRLLRYLCLLARTDVTCAVASYSNNITSHNSFIFVNYVVVQSGLELIFRLVKVAIMLVTIVHTNIGITKPRICTKVWRSA